MFFSENVQAPGKENVILWPQNNPAWEYRGQKLILVLYFLIYMNFVHLNSQKQVQWWKNSLLKRATCIKLPCIFSKFIALKTDVNHFLEDLKSHWRHDAWSKSLRRDWKEEGLGHLSTRSLICCCKLQGRHRRSYLLKWAVNQTAVISGSPV